MVQLLQKGIQIKKNQERRETISREVLPLVLP